MNKPASKIGVVADKIEHWSIEDLVPYARNAKTHPPEQVAQIAASMREFGFTIPVLVADDGTIIAGHGRVLAANELGIDTVPVIVAHGWSDEQRRAYTLADNKISENGGWDDELLLGELSFLADAGFNADLTGFSSAEISGLFDALGGPKPGNTDDDHVPAIDDAHISSRGDVWVLGNHRVMCGDSTDADDVAALVDGELCDMCWTDPPYNVNYEGGTGLKIQNDFMADGPFREFLLQALRCMASSMREGAPIYVAHADTEGLNFRWAFREAGFKLSGCLIWVKPSLVLGRSDYQWRHEPILYGWKPGAAHSWYGGRAKTTVFEAGDMPFTVSDDGSVSIELGQTSLVISGDNLCVEEVNQSVIRAEKPAVNREHPTMKPVDLIIQMLVNSSQRGDVVLDLFGGSGSTMIACEKTDRSSRLMELDPKYCDVIVRRWQEFTGRKATLDLDGRTFDEVGKSRCKVA